MNTLTPLALLMLFFCINLHAQQPEPEQKTNSEQRTPVSKQAAVPQPTESAQPMEMGEWLNTENAAKRVERLAGLGVDRDVATEFTRETDLSAKWYPLHTEPGPKNAILFLPCVRDNAHLYLLVKRNKVWQVTDFEKPDCHYDMSVSVEIAPIRNPAFDEVLMHHVGEGHGAGYSQQDFEVFSVKDGKLKQVLDAEEVILAMQYVGPDSDMNKIDQKSTFVLVPIQNSRSRVVEETQSYKFNHKLTVKRRQFRWNADKGRYTPTKFTPVVAASH